MFGRNHNKVVSGVGGISTQIVCFGKQFPKRGAKKRESRMDFSHLGGTLQTESLFVWLFCFCFCVNMTFQFVAVERRLSGNEVESHETLAQRIEKDVVGFTHTPAFTTEISSQLCLSHCFIHAKPSPPLPSLWVFVPHSKSSTAPSTTSRSLYRGCRRQRRPSLSSTIATRVRRTRRKDQQVCPPFFSCCGTSALTIC